MDHVPTGGVMTVGYISLHREVDTVWNTDEPPEGSRENIQVRMWFTGGNSTRRNFRLLDTIDESWSQQNWWLMHDDANAHNVMLCRLSWFYQLKNLPSVDERRTIYSNQAHKSERGKQYVKLA